MNTKQVIIARKELMMPEGKLASQVAHASLGCILDQFEKTSKLEGDIYSKLINTNSPLKHWLDESFTKIVLGCDGLGQLLTIKKFAEEAMLNVCLITDNGDTVFKGVPTITCMAIGPDRSEEIDKITGHLKLY